MMTPIKQTKRTRKKPIEITRDQFHALVKKAAQPLGKASESGSASAETSESHRSDGCSEKNTRSRKTGDIGD